MRISAPLVLVVTTLTAGCKSPESARKAPERASASLSTLLAFVPGQPAEAIRKGLKELGSLARYDNGTIRARVAHPWFDAVAISTDSDTGEVTSWMFTVRPGVLSEANLDAFADAIEKSSDRLNDKRRVIDDKVIGTFHYEFGHAADTGKKLATLDPNLKGKWNGDDIDKATLMVCSSVRGKVCESLIRDLSAARFPDPPRP